jgi:hypothetical protein
MEMLDKKKSYEYLRGKIMAYNEAIAPLIKIKSEILATTIPTYIYSRGKVKTIYPESYHKQNRKINDLIEQTRKLIFKD